MLKQLFAGIRLFCFALWTAYWLLVVTVHIFTGGKNKVRRGLRFRRTWARGFVWIMRFRVRWEGDFPGDETCLYVGNHRSSLDPLIILARVLAYPVSRAEVRNWPLVGKGSALTGIIFVDKSSRASRQKVKQLLLDEMRLGHSILIFPEGKTNVAPTTATFQKGSFEQAAQGGFKVVPFVLEYKDTRDYWDHTDSFAVHFLKRFGKWNNDMHIAFGPPLQSENSWTLLRGAQEWIDGKILEVRKGFDGGITTR